MPPQDAEDVKLASVIADIKERFELGPGVTWQGFPGAVSMEGSPLTTGLLIV